MEGVMGWSVESVRAQRLEFCRLVEAGSEGPVLALRYKEPRTN